MIQGKKILLVDDDERNIFALSAVLKTKGPVLLVAKNGIECLELLRKHPDVDLVLLDMMMPEMDGYQALQEIRADSRIHHIPVIALTAQAMNGDREKCLAAGANDYCSKPVEVDHLFSKMNLLLK